MKEKGEEELLVVIPEGSVNVRCLRCRRFHVVKKGEPYTCPWSISENTTEGWYILATSNEDIEQTSNFENIKVRLGY